MELKDRLTAIKDARDFTWKSLAQQLDISEAMLFRCLSGTRKPSRRFLKRIEALESGYTIPGNTPRRIVGESPAPYMSKKELNKRDIEHRLTTICAEIAAIREILKETEND
jgi:transcriptional regulator with XRE-family HTH domain